LSRASTSCFRAAKEDVDGRAFAAPKRLRPRRRVKPMTGRERRRNGPQPLTEPQTPGSNPRMRTDLIFAMALAAVSAILAVAGFFIMEWSPIVIGLLIGVMLAADGYFVWGLIGQNKKPPAS